MNKPLELIPNTFKHREAFCLMWYECVACRHLERIWNSRDGVTPFMMQCPSCARPQMKHVMFDQDVRAEGYKPNIGQKVWVDMTKENALKYAHARMRQIEQSGSMRGMPADEIISLSNAILEYIYRGGQAPNLAIYGVEGYNVK